MRRFAGVWSLLLAGLSLAGLAMGAVACEGDPMQRVRISQYPPDFHYITKQEIRTTMAELAVEVVALDGLLTRPAQPAEREAVLETLTRMRALAGQLVRGGARSSHPRLDQDAHRLREGLDRAIAEARMSAPPTYYEAGRIVGTCTVCHVQRHEVSLLR